MNRLLLVAGLAVGACAIAVPAAAGLSSNPSFSEHVPVRVPSSARVVSFDDHGHATSSPHATASPTTAPRHAEPGDDRGTHTEPADDRGRRTEPGDDRGTHTEPADDRGRHGGDDATRGHHGKDG